MGRLLTVLNSGGLTPNKTNRLTRSILPSLTTVNPLKYNPTLWLAASVSSSISGTGSNVAQWSDLSGNVNHVTQGTEDRQPLIGSVTLNGLNTVTFDGINDFLTAATKVIDTDTDELTVFLVTTFPAPTGPNTLCGTELIAKLSINAAEGFGFLSSANGSSWELARVPVDATPGLTGIASLRLGVDTTGYSFCWNGVQEGAESGVFSGFGSNSNKFVVGGKSASSENFAGSIGEIIVYPRALTDIENSTVYSYLNRKWIP